MITFVQNEKESYEKVYRFHPRNWFLRNRNRPNASPPSSVLLHSKTFSVPSLLSDIGGAHFAIKIISAALSPDMLLLRPRRAQDCSVRLCACRCYLNGVCSVSLCQILDEVLDGRLAAVKFSKDYFSDKPIKGLFPREGLSLIPL